MALNAKKKTIPARSKKRNPSYDLARLIVETAENNKASEPVVLDVSQTSGFADYLVVLSGTSLRHIQALADHVEEAVSKKLKRNPLSIEGNAQSVWVLVDYGDVVCHVFLNESRDFYRLEELWHDANHVHFHA